MGYDPDDEYEPDDEHGICTYCGNECRIIGVDFGIGGYEFQGQCGTHSDVRPVSDCCEEPVKGME